MQRGHSLAHQNAQQVYCQRDRFNGQPGLWQGCLASIKIFHDWQPTAAQPSDYKES